MLNLSNQQIDEQMVVDHPLKTLQALPMPRSSRKLGRWMLFFLFLTIVVLFLPWRQNISGTGSITALTPQDRPQSLQNAIAGRIERWSAREGQYVRKGDTLLVISEIKDDYFDPNLPQRLNEQLAAKKGSRLATEAKIKALDGQISALTAGVKVDLASARNKVQQSLLQVRIDSTDLVAIQRNYQIAVARLERYEKGYRDGLFSLTDLEGRRLTLQQDYAKVQVQDNKLGVSRQSLVNAQLNLQLIQAKYEQEVAKTMSDRSSAVSSQASANNEIAVMRNKISNVDVRRGLYIIRAPQNGYIVRALKAGIGETIKEGESIATLQPDNPTMAVELYVRAMDVPLIQRGRMVRLQFDGWPAIQFSGWPAVAVGTFGGKVVVIDAVSSTNGKYRLLVRPEAMPSDQPWPEQLRVGSGVVGWVMLDDVPIWYEIWRQLNGFPPSLQEEPQIKEKV
ncbi:HlyD family efflux transporter periplasmic adaptor subunit [Spirosoma aureum]|uniref:HlyD family efflux transporter periplasmic adaptor subunit n=1 Tax=Spirosoma aureum TaxID=2692134 RepID=A0A6G9AVM9_9BACT|nr:HlyD family efflux transporter periplasmic adaptor subunit [Spirosoma aureum]QIP16537.1 HlyD family efflux transporter periplasmic adaptor subunit [Spirosoma aureum]